MKTFKTLIVAFLLIAMSPATAQDADQIIANYFENTGGLENWSAIKSMEISGKITFGPQEFNFTQTTIADGRMAIEVDLQGMKFIPNAFDGKKMWTTNFQSMEPEELDTETSENYLINDAKDFPDPFLNSSEKGYSYILMGEEQVEGVDTYKIKLTKNQITIDGKKEDYFAIYYFDKENFVPIVQESITPSGPQKGTVVKTVFSDYQEAGDVFVPYSIDIKYNDVVAQSISITKVALNSEINEDIFIMPVKEAATEKK